LVVFEDFKKIFASYDFARDVEATARLVGKTKSYSDIAGELDRGFDRFRKINSGAWRNVEFILSSEGLVL